jgi:hypothetical protein
MLYGAKNFKSGCLTIKKAIFASRCAPKTAYVATKQCLKLTTLLSPLFCHKITVFTEGGHCRS